MERLQALARGRSVRQQLVHSVREEYETTVREIEGRDCVTGISVVHWPKSKTLCFPVFQEERPHPLINTSPGEEKSHMCTVPLPEVVSSPSPSPSSLSHDMSHVTALCDDNGENNNCQANATHSHSPLLAQDPRNNSTTSLLAGENLLEGRDALLELGYQTATELVWIKQAISSRQKYIQLKQQMRTQ